MATFTSDGLDIAYDAREPAAGGAWLILVHGFASNRHEGWRRTGWYAALALQGRVPAGAPPSTSAAMAKAPSRTTRPSTAVRPWPGTSWP
jgi:pimeloyl-ACP methyl ester carboxylesterase